MKNIVKRFAVLLLIVVVIACVDEAKDPVKFNEVKKATYLAIRGASNDALVATGCSNSFFKNNILSTDAFTVESDFLSEDQETLQEVKLFAQTPTINRVLVTTFPGSNWTLPSGATTKRGTFSVPLATILTKLGLTTATAASLKNADITMSIDLVLTDGSTVLGNSIVAPGLFASVVFQPAMVLTYCANNTKDFLPIATTSMLGTWALDKDKKVVRGEIPSLKDGVSDTLYIRYDQVSMKVAPIVTFDPPTAGTVTKDVTPYKKEKNGFYVVYKAGSTYTGEVTATVSGGVATVAGADLTQEDTEHTINVDNIAPVVSRSTGTRIGAGQFVTMKVSSNEKLSTKSGDVILVNVDGTALGLETVKDAKMTIAANGLSASLIYIFKLKDPLVQATHGDLVVTFSKAIDEAGNSTTIGNGVLTVDLNAPPAPTITATGMYDFGTQIRWSADQSVDATPVTGNPGGSDTGSVYFVAIASGKPRPTGFAVDLDGVATWTMPDDPASTKTPKEKVAIMDEGVLEVEEGGSGLVFTSFGANGTFDIYAVFVSSSGTISKISSSAPVVAPGVGNPLTITMN